MGWKPGEIDGQPARVKETGTRVEAITKTGAEHDHIVANDGMNADYVRIGGQVIVDNNRPNPYGASPPPVRVVNPPC